MQNVINRASRPVLSGLERRGHDLKPFKERRASSSAFLPLDKRHH